MKPSTWPRPQLRKSLVALLFLFPLLALGQASWLDRLLGLQPATNAPTTATPGLNSLSQEQMVQGLKQALDKGVRTAVNDLGHPGGFLTNLAVKILMPPQLKRVETVLRDLKQDKLADDFVTSMNQAAEQAVPLAAGVFGKAVQQMTVADAAAILTGPDDAATQYFRRVTQTNLHAQFLPMVKAATDKAGATALYKQLMTTATGKGFLGGLGATLLQPESVDLDSYVTDKALDGLFKKVAEEEKQIRQNPVARTSALLQQVFGAVAR